MVKYLINKIPVFYSEDWSKYGNLKGKLMELKKLTERIYYTESDSKSDRPVLSHIGIGIIHLGCMLLMQKPLLIIKQMKNYIDFPHGCGVMEQ